MLIIFSKATLTLTSAEPADTPSTNDSNNEQNNIPILTNNHRIIVRENIENASLEEDQISEEDLDEQLSEEDLDEIDIGSD